jgi:hypothetical protein
MRQNASKGSATLRLKVVICALASGIEFTRENIGFDLTVPLSGAKLIEPPREKGQLVWRKSRDYKFKFFNAHVVILSLSAHVVNPERFRVLMNGLCLRVG